MTIKKYMVTLEYEVTKRFTTEVYAASEEQALEIGKAQLVDDRKGIDTVQNARLKAIK